MPDRFARIAIVVAIGSLALFVARRYPPALLYSADTARAATARGELSPAKASTAALFERSSPSVVHVFAQAAVQARA